MGEHSDRYPKTQYELLMENERAIRDATAHRQQGDHAAKITATLQGQAQAAIARGVQPGRLPRIRANMSPADVAEAQAHLNEANGMNPTQARDPAFIHSQLFPATGVGASTGLPLPAPVGARGTAAAAPSDQLGPPPVADARGLLTANALRKDLPTPDMNDAAAKVAAAAGTGQVVQTPYGTASSTSPARGTARTDAVTTDTGVQHLTPFQQVVRNHPQVGIAGTPENLAYVKAYKAAQDAPDGEKDPVKLGLALFNPRQSPSLTGPAGELAPAQSADIKAPPAIGGPTRPVMFAGSDVSGNLPAWKGPADDPTVGAQAADYSRSRYETQMQDPLSPRTLANKVNRGLEVGIGNTVDFFRHLYDPKLPSVMLPDKPLFPNNPGAVTGAPSADPSYTLPSGPGSTPPKAMSMELPAPAGSPPLSSTSGVGPWQPDADSQAFAQNPEEDLFRKRLREPQQLSYA